uniref:HscB mitochondrial iron-sulfur cluster cochaperone n=1 Tax=Mastacembelus armatus TaxID=205130 RepID=A0A7N8XT44_9TELE
MLISDMLSVNSRIVRSSRAVLHLNWLMTEPLPVYKTVTCLAHFPSKDIWHSNMTLRPRSKTRELICYSNNANVPRGYCTGQVKLNCWKCKQPIDKTPAFFCMSCKVVQPSEEGTSYFKIMDCDYTFTLDIQKLQKRYLQLQRSLHPDNFSQKSMKEQEYSESQSALVNKAYKTLLKPLSRGVYMLKLQGMHIEDGTESGTESEFLIKLMEINEALHEAQTPEEANQIGQDTKGKQIRQFSSLKLHAAKALLVQMKYYANVEEKVKKKLSEFM